MFSSPRSPFASSLSRGRASRANDKKAALKVRGGGEESESSKSNAKMMKKTKKTKYFQSLGFYFDIFRHLIGRGGFLRQTTLLIVCFCHTTNRRQRRRQHVLFLLDGSANGIVCEPILCLCCYCRARVPCASASVCALSAAAVHIFFEINLLRRRGKRTVTR